MIQDYLFDNIKEKIWTLNIAVLPHPLYFTDLVRLFFFFISLQHRWGKNIALKMNNLPGQCHCK